MGLTERTLPEEIRAHYEAQGRAAIAGGQTIQCSEPTVTRAVLDLILPHAHELNRVLDVGCGSNLKYDLTLADLGIQIVAVDFSSSFLELAPRHPRVELRLADAASLPFEQASFDGVICSEVAEHVPDDRAVVNEIARVLRPGGLLVFTVPILWNLARLTDMVRRRSFHVEMMEGHLREYSRRQALALLRPHFEVERVLPVPFGWRGPFGTPLDGLVRSGFLARASKSFAALARRRV
jgi:SAM-dependent methyltransferase